LISYYFQPGYPPQADFAIHTIQGLDQDFWISQLTWRTGHIAGVWVHEKYRRRGIATTMLKIADHYNGSPLSHSPRRTQDGLAWSLTTGHEVPPNNTLLGSYRPTVRKLYRETLVDLGVLL
jgi:ribosomal protein S18 acetylase RimI-like enzyme